ncbi:MAG: IclR family transcriptional regulator [Acidimicrobiia bacterium]
MTATGERTLKVLEYLAQQGASSLRKLAADLELNKATAHRFVTALVKTGYAHQDPTTRDYAPTTKLLELGNSVLDKIDVRRQVRPHLENLAHTTGETAHLAVLEGLEIVYIDKVDGNQAVTMKSRVGARASCHSTALGKTLLAHQPRSEWQRYVSEVGLPQRTPRTVTDPARFEKMLEAVREAGYALDDIENEEGIRCVACPVFDHTGEVAAAMSISGWTVSMTPERAHGWIPSLLETAHDASLGLGYKRTAP